jgi:hypothetical protein
MSNLQRPAEEGEEPTGLCTNVNQRARAGHGCLPPASYTSHGCLMLALATAMPHRPTVTTCLSEQGCPRCRRLRWRLPERCRLSKILLFEQNKRPSTASHCQLRHSGGVTRSSTARQRLGSWQHTPPPPAFRSIPWLCCIRLLQQQASNHQP